MLLFECEKGGDSEHRQRNKIIQDRDDFAPGDSFFADEDFHIMGNKIAYVVYACHLTDKN